MSKTINLIHVLLLAAALALATSSAFAMGGGGTSSSQLPPAVPEPTAVVLFALGLGALVVARRLRNRM
jgi:hypothetical protein